MVKVVVKLMFMGVFVKGEDVVEVYLWLMNDSNVIGVVVEMDFGGLLV